MPNSLPFDELCANGRVHLKAGRLDEAQAAFDEARRINDLDADVHEGLATITFLRQEYDVAVMHFERVTRLDPRRERAQRGLERAEAELDATKKKTTPFGRLVNPDGAPAAHGETTIPSRTLSDEERQADRHTLHDVMTQVESDIDELLETLSD